MEYSPLTRRALSFALAVVALGMPSAIATSADPEAEQLTEQGHHYLEKGQPFRAYKVWKQAIARYRKRNQKERVRQLLINQAAAQQAMGQQFNACWSLIEVLDFDAALCRSHNDVETKQWLSGALDKLSETPTNVAALQHLGIVSRELWKLEQSNQLLDHALRLALTTNDPTTEYKVRLSIANTQQANLVALREQHQLSDEDRLRERLQRQSIQVGKQVLEQLTYLSRHADHPLSQQANLNWLQYYQRLQQWIATDGQYSYLIPLRGQADLIAAEVIPKLTTSEFRSLSAIDSINARLKVAENLLKLKQGGHPIPGLMRQPLQVAFQLSKSSLEQAKGIRSDRAEALALTTLGKLYMETGQDSIALGALSRAQNLATSISAADLVYQAAWPLARLNRKLGRRQSAIKSYQNALSALEGVRSDLLLVNRTLQYSFRDEIQPLYQQYLSLLLEAEQPDYETIIAVNSDLRIAALENYLQCGKLEFTPLKSVPNLPTTFHFIDSGKQIEVLVRTEGKLQHYTADAKLVKQTTQRLQQLLQSPSLKQANPETLLPLSQALYKALIQPGEHLIGVNKQLLYTDSGALDNVPLGFLHDGTSYLIEKYQVSASLGAQLRATQPKRSRLKVLFAGIAQQSPSFTEFEYESLPEVEQEEAFITETLGTSSTASLLNQRFTMDRLKEKLPRYSILHIATHAKFSSDPTQTHLLAWREPLGLSDLERLLQVGNGARKGLELLFLSACETAKGDTRSQLGLAGLATQTGARNAIASLWRVESRSTTQLAGEFYRALADGKDISAALQQAQLKLLKSESYSHPYHWAPFILLGGTS